MAVRIMVGDALSRLRELPDGSVHCCVTSPPYWGLRSYGGDPGMIGLESTFAEHLESLVAVFREVWRVLRPDGTLWLNYGDAYRPQGKGGQGVNGQMGDRSIQQARQHQRPSAPFKPKDLMLMPARVAMALQADAWWLRSEIIWHKPNPMPESVTDRPTSAHEKLFLLSKAARYFYDAEAVRVPMPTSSLKRYESPMQGDQMQARQPGRERERPNRMVTPATGGANLRNVWKIPTFSFSQAHFATFPPKLVEPCVKASTSEHGVCAECGAPWVREVDTTHRNDTTTSGRPATGNNVKGVDGASFSYESRTRKHVTTTGWRPTCECMASVVPATILDPFAGVGTVGLVADRLDRDAILIEINPEYAAMAESRIHGDAPLFTEVTNG